MKVYVNHNPYECPKCGSLDQRTCDSRTTGSGRRRRRICEACGNRYTTYELTEEDYKNYVKSRYVAETYVRLIRLMAETEELQVPIELETDAAGGEDV